MKTKAGRPKKYKPLPKVHKILQKEDFELNETDGKILRLSLDYENLTDKQIGEIVGLSREQVNKIKNKPIFKKIYNEYQKKAIDIIISAKTEAAIKMKKLINSKDERVAIKASENILGDDLKEKVITIVDLSKAIENLDNAIGAAKANS